MAFDPKVHIKSLYEARATNQLWCEDQADVGTFAEGLLSGSRFFNELLQNADDAGASELDYQLIGEELVVSHNGRHFTASDVEKIIRFAQQKIRDKSENTEATGYKGIGFKALASIACKIYILSQDYTFRFDKQHWNGKKIPWQMVPIWTEINELPLHLQPVVERLAKKVVFVFHLNFPAVILSQMEEGLQKTQAILFLRHIRKLQIEWNGKQKLITREESGDGPFVTRTIKVGKSVRSHWQVMSLKMKIDAEVGKSVKTLNPTLCPDRLKSASHLVLTFAFPTENGMLTSSKEVELYNTLPLKMQIGLPFSINGEFLVEAQREQLVDSLWNENLFKLIARLHFYCLEKIASQEQWHQILYGLAPASLPFTTKKLADSYAEGFNEGAAMWPIMPSFHDCKTLLKLGECCWDTTGFYDEFRDLLPADLVPRNLVNPNIRYLNKLEQFDQVLKIRLKDILEKLEEIFKRKPDPQLCYRVLVFFQKYNWHDFSALKCKEFIPVQQGGAEQVI